MKLILITFAIAVVLVGGALVITRTPKTNNIDPVNNVSMVNGKQVIDLRAKGGYSPRKSVAKAGIHTILKVNTNATFDCSSSFRIPSMSISKNLPPTGTTEVDLGNPVVGILQGTCGMGMYPFEIDFQG